MQKSTVKCRLFILYKLNKATKKGFELIESFIVIL